MMLNGFLTDAGNQKVRSFLEPFLLSREAEGRSQATLIFYRQKLDLWFRWLDHQGVTTVAEVTPQVIRAYLLDLKADHSQGGTHSFYRSIKAFFRWMWYEYDFDWPNPILKVKCEANRMPPIEGVAPEHVERILAAAKEGKHPERDCAIVAVLLDSGIRKSSLAGIRCGDVDLVNGSIFINHVKTGRQYTVYLGKLSRKYVRAYAKVLPDSLDPEAAFWRSRYGDALAAGSFHWILRRISERAGVPAYSLHDYRRYFALESYRNGADIYEIAQMLGHTGIGVTERYLAVNAKDRARIHSKVSPLDKNQPRG